MAWVKDGPKVSGFSHFRLGSVGERIHRARTARSWAVEYTPPALEI